MRRLLVVVVLVAGCGGNASSATGPSSPGAAGGAGANGAAGSGGVSSVCPSTMPEPGTPCGASYALCSFGDDPVALCRPIMSCSSGAWSQPAVDPMCPAARDACPTDLGACHGSAVCATADGATCECTGVLPNFSWLCATPPKPPCPESLPNEGARCDVSADVHCAYSVSCGYYLSTVATCEGGTWAWALHTSGCM